ncbi:MAG: YceI family protein [Bacteroidales bacterium]
MKTKINRSFLFLFLLSGLMLYQCGKDNTYTVAGNVTYGDAIPARGAVVSVSTDSTAGTILNSVVSDAEGFYSIAGLNEGSYYLSSHFNTENVNILKSAGYNFRTASPVLVEVLEDITMDITLVTEPGGNDKVNSEDGSWRFDKAHSNVNWSTAYMGDNALLTGKFNSFGIDIDFDEAVPANIKIRAWVQLSSANTGEPGRDNLGNCLNGYLGVETDTLTDGSYYVSDLNTDTAYYKSTTVTSFGDGYKASGDLIFKGITKEVDLYFNYLGQADYSAAGDGSNFRGSFKGEFEFNAISDYGVTSTSISDKINVSINANYRKN